MTAPNFSLNRSIVERYIRFASVHLRAWYITPTSRHVGKIGVSPSRQALTSTPYYETFTYPSEASEASPDTRNSPQPNDIANGADIVRLLRFLLQS